MQKIIVFTGSFNPITKAHSKLLEDAINSINADKGLFVCTNNDYLTKKIVVNKKSTRPFILSEAVRKETVESLCKDNPKFGFGGFELGGVAPSTGRTIVNIMKDYPNAEFYYLFGADKLPGVPNWNNVTKMLESNKLKFIVYPRDGFDVESIINNNEFLSLNRDKILTLIPSKETEGISSTLVRNRFFAGQDYSDLLDEGPAKILSRFKPEDIKEITPEELIEATIKFGGRFGENAARLLVYKENTKLFNNWNNQVLGDREAKIKNTKVYNEGFRVNSNNSYTTEFDCKNIDCIDYAFDLINQGYNPAILNLASAVQPCGGYNKGILAQEEALCYSSTLSQSLYQFAPNPKLKYFKDANLTHVPGVYPLDLNFGGIYSPNVCFFRNNNTKNYSLRDNVFECSVISVASLSNRAANEFTNGESCYFDSLGYLTAEGREIEKNKIRTIYRIALDNNHDSLVLGAFGCGVYNLRPVEVSRLFKDVLSETEFNGKFKKIVFAIFEGNGSSRKKVGKEGKFKPFYDKFSK